MSDDIIQWLHDYAEIEPQAHSMCDTAAEEIARLRMDLAKCGKENCMGREIEGHARWVREERLIEARNQLVTKDRLINWIDSPTVEALANIFDPHQQIPGKSYGEQIVEVLARRLLLTDEIVK